MTKRTKEVEQQIDKNLEEPKKTKKNVEKKAVTKTTKKTNAVKKVSNKKSTSVKKETSTIKNKSTKTKSTASTTKVSSKKSTTSKEKIPTKKVSTKKTPTTKKTASKSTTSRKTKSVKSASKTKTKSTKKQSFSLEYYDLPYRYNQTIVTILAQTPKNLFVYWDISDIDRKNLEKQYGSHFFEITKPVLIIHNDSMNYSFEIDIDDFANSWYIPVDNSNSEYRIELGRRPIPINYNYIQNNGEEIHPVETPYIYLTSSNEIKSPNNRILFNLGNKVYFRNVKTNEVLTKDISSFLLLSNIGRFYNLFDLYKHFYKDEELLTKEFDLFGLSSSGNPSSGFLSSQFK